MYQYFITNLNTVLIGGAVIVGTVIFIMGLLKTSIFNRIKNKLVRKILLSFTSVILVMPATAISVYSQGCDFTYFWVKYIAYAVFTILVYWFYENTGIRNLLELIGRNTVAKLIHAKPEEVSKVLTEVHKDADTMINDSKSYSEDDLKNL